MNKVKIITDSCSDISKDLREKYDIDYARMTLNWGDEEKYASLDWDLYSVKELYDAIRSGIRITTNQVTVAEYERVFGMYLEQGYDIVYVACSSALSGSISVARIVADRFAEKYPNNKILCVDPKNACMGEAIIAIEAAKLAAQGLSADEVAQRTEAIAPKAMQFCTVGTLTYFKRAGRVKATTAFFGNLFGVKPIVISNRNGENEAVKKVKGRKNSLDELVTLLQNSLTDSEYPASEQTVYVVHADCIDDANYLAEQIKAKINPKDIYINTIGPIIGATTGPETVALYAFGDQYAALEG